MLLADDRSARDRVATATAEGVGAAEAEATTVALASGGDKAAVAAEATSLDDTGGDDEGGVGLRVGEGPWVFAANVASPPAALRAERWPCRRNELRAGTASRMGGVADTAEMIGADETAAVVAADDSCWREDSEDDELSEAEIGKIDEGAEGEKRTNEADDELDDDNVDDEVGTPSPARVPSPGSKRAAGRMRRPDLDVVAADAEAVEVADSVMGDDVADNGAHTSKLLSDDCLMGAGVETRSD